MEETPEKRKQGEWHGKKCWAYDSKDGTGHPDSPFVNQKVAAEALGVTGCTISYAIKRPSRNANGWQIRPTPGYIAPDHKPYIYEVLTFHKGEISTITPCRSQKEVAKVTGFSLTHVYEVLKRDMDERFLGRKFFLRGYTGEVKP